MCWVREGEPAAAREPDGWRDAEVEIWEREGGKRGVEGRVLEAVRKPVVRRVESSGDVKVWVGMVVDVGFVVIVEMYFAFRSSDI